MNQKYNCPECGELTDCQFIDIGIGVEYGPPYCLSCGWSAYENAGKIIDNWYHDASGMIHSINRIVDNAHYLGGDELVKFLKEVYEI